MTISKIPKLFRDAHKVSFKNEQLVKKSKMCGCFSCGKIFPATEIVNWAPDGVDRTAMCPYCLIDSVIPDASGWLMDGEFLEEMNRYWFGLNDSAESGSSVS